MIKIGTNFEYLGEQFLDGRQGIESLSSLESWGSPVPLGFEVFVSEKDAWYIYVGTDDSTGKKIWVPRISSTLEENIDLRKYIGVTQEYIGDSLTEIQHDINLLLDEKFPYILSLSRTSVTATIGYNYSAGGSKSWVENEIKITITGKKKGTTENVGWDTLKINGETSDLVSDKNTGSAVFTASPVTLSFGAGNLDLTRTSTITFSANWMDKKTGTNKEATATFEYELKRSRPSTYIGYTTSSTMPSEDDIVSTINSYSSNPNKTSVTLTGGGGIMGRVYVKFGAKNKVATISIGGFVDSNWTIYTGTDNTYGPYTIYIHNNYELIDNTRVEVS